MPEEMIEKLDESWDDLPFEVFVRRQLMAISNRLAVLEKNYTELRTEIIERFQMRDLSDKKVDVFVQEHLYLKRDVQDIQESLEQRH